MPKTKQAKLSEESSNDGNSTGDTSNSNSTGDENASTDNSTGDKKTSTGNSTGDKSASVTMTSLFDTTLKHVLNNYLSATGADHLIRQAFIHEQILTFEDFTGRCTVENIKTFQQDDGTNTVQAFSNVKLTMIGNVLLY